VLKYTRPSDWTYGQLVEQDADWSEYLSNSSLSHCSSMSIKQKKTLLAEPIGNIVSQGTWPIIKFLKTRIETIR
jgi:hypothetical protein